MRLEMERRLKREGTYVYLQLIHGDVWQKPTQHCKAIILQLQINKFFKNRGRGYVYTADSLCCTAETRTILWSNYTPIKNNSKVCLYTCYKIFLKKIWILCSSEYLTQNVIVQLTCLHNSIAMFPDFFFQKQMCK